MTVNNFQWKIGGEAGYGIMSAGEMFARAMLRAGLYALDYDEYPSLIRGGHNTYQVRISDQKIYSPVWPIDILVALNQETVELHKNELSPDAAVIINTDNSKVDHTKFVPTIKLFPIPLDTLVKEIGGKEVMRNVVALGASFALLQADFQILKDIVIYNFTGKDQAIIDMNVKAGQAGYDYIKKNFPEGIEYKVEIKGNGQGRIIMTGNEALAWGAIKAGCKFIASYPMTPATSIFINMISQARKYNIIAKQSEDEISAINMACAAGYTGVRAMTCSSGGGFSLMVEALGMAGMMEIPVVIAEVMRPGPSTGLPTWTSQADLKFAINSSQGEFPKVVMAPGDVEQCFYMIQDAFNLAEKYQLPVIILSDKFLGVSHRWVDNFDFDRVKINRGEVSSEAALAKISQYKRYEDSSTGVSPRALPGTRDGEHVANSDEHNELSFSEEGSDEVMKMVDKRFKKMQTIINDIPGPIFIGDKKADFTFISWGSTRGPILEAMKLLSQKGIKTNFLQITYLHPFPARKVAEVINSAKRTVLVECSKTGQLASLVKENTGHELNYHLLKYDGRPFYPEEIFHSVKELK